MLIDKTLYEGKNMGNMNIDLHAGSLHADIIVCRPKDGDGNTYAVRIQNHDDLWDIYCNDLNLSWDVKNKCYQLKTIKAKFTPYWAWKIDPSNWVRDVTRVVKSGYNKDLSL